jgi:uncharacterized protein
MRPVKIAIILLFIVFLPCQILASENIRKVAVTGKSEIVVEAHYAVIQLSVRDVKNEMSQSHAELLKTISALIKGLKTIGIPDTDIKKSLILQGQEESWEENSKVLKGCYSECLIDLYIKDINKISDVYKELADHQDVSIQGTDFKRNDEFDIRKTEYEKALQAAKNKAEYMAQALGARIGNVYSIQEVVGSENYFEAKAISNITATGSGGENAGYGNIKISAQVLVEYELE